MKLRRLLFRLFYSKILLFVRKRKRKQSKRLVFSYVITTSNIVIAFICCIIWRAWQRRGSKQMEKWQELAKEDVNETRDPVRVYP